MCVCVGGSPARPRAEGRGRSVGRRGGAPPSPSPQRPPGGRRQALARPPLTLPQPLREAGGAAALPVEEEQGQDGQAARGRQQPQQRRPRQGPHGRRPPAGPARGEGDWLWRGPRGGGRRQLPVARPPPPPPPAPQKDRAEAWSRSTLPARRVRVRPRRDAAPVGNSPRTPGLESLGRALCRVRPRAPLPASRRGPPGASGGTRGRKTPAPPRHAEAAKAERLPLLRRAPVLGQAKGPPSSASCISPRPTRCLFPVATSLHLAFFRSTVAYL